jgi:hypothetical protein
LLLTPLKKIFKFELFNLIESSGLAEIVFDIQDALIAFAIADAKAVSSSLSARSMFPWPLSNPPSILGTRWKCK